MSQNNYMDSSYNSDEECKEKLDFEYKPTFVLIAVDTHPSMFIKVEDEGKSIPFKQCLSVCYEISSSLLYNQNKRSWSPFSVVVNGSDEAGQTITEFQNVIESIKILNNERSLSNEELIKKYQRKGDVDLGAFFLFCKKKFKEIQSAYYKRIIVYITNDDNPLINKNKRFTALNEAKNFEANDIQFQLITMNPNFNYKIFYNELFSIINSPPIEEFIEDEEGLMEKLTSVILFRHSQIKTCFYLFPNYHKKYIRVIRKKFISEFKLYENEFVSLDGKPIKKVIPEQIITGYDYDLPTTSLEFTLEEYNQLNKNNLPLGYTLIMVSNRVSEIGCSVSNPSLLQVHHKESPKIFNAFWAYCYKKNKVLICARKFGHDDKIRFVEFIPKYANKTKFFLLKDIPFNEQIIPLEEEEEGKVKEEDIENGTTDEEGVKIIKELVDSLTFEYYPKMFSDTELDVKKAFIKSKLLDTEVEEVEDPTENLDGVDSQIGEVARKFNSYFRDDDDEGTGNTVKRAIQSRGYYKKNKS